MGVARSLTIALVAALAACGGKSNVDLDGDAGADDILDWDAGVDIDGDGDIDCVPVVGAAQCANCIDDDDDGLIDGFDPECTGAADLNEGSFSTGISGDNIDAKKQDCFFDGNSGADFGGQQISTCCLLQDGECPTANGGGADGVGSFDRATDCEYSEEAAAECGAQTPPGCDCFGCCTVCVDAGCFDILANTTVSPDCDQDTVGTDACPTCVKQETCTGGECDADPDDCVLCPGESTSDLPAACDGGNTCPGGNTPCTTGGDECSGGQYCSGGCCVDSVG
jgi:hypothetical protein